LRPVVPPQADKKLTALDGSALGKATTYPDRYDPALLFPVEREGQRRALGLRGQLPFGGADLWTAYELTWLDARGKPQAAIGEFRIPCDSAALIESKSMKLYLGSFAQEPLESRDELTRRIQADLSSACGAHVAVALAPPDWAGDRAAADLPGESIDATAIATAVYETDPAALAGGNSAAEETLRSALFRSRCPVTGQPDFADIMVRYRGPRIDRAGLLRYLVSYRCHAAFHESCVERIFIDIEERCAPQALSVYARFMRRGGIDINPFRSNFEPGPPPGARTRRQ
jgi:7-cyano-7-deazaguanine reductase